jgi:predicted TIM-barrel fold metal-dependent hydrolase
MKKPSISRRHFMKGLSAGALSLMIVPSCTTRSAEKSDQTMRSLPPFFDCNKYIGPGFPKSPDFPKATDLLAHMDRLGIDRAVAWHTNARDLNTMAGNEQLIREIEAASCRERIIPSFIIAPTMIDEQDIMDHFLDLVRKHHIHAFHFFPQKAGWSLLDITPVIRLIQVFKPVLFLDSFENMGDDLSSIMDFAAEFPQVSIIFTNAMWVHYNKLYKLMEARPNIFVDTSLLHMYLTHEYFIKNYGVERLIFGTGYKSNNGAAIASLAHAEISTTHAQMIAHGNLERMLGIEAPLSGTRPVTGDRLWHRLLRQEQPGPDIIDGHTHMSRTLAKWEDHDQADIASHARQALRRMDKMGVSSMIIAEYTVYDPDLASGKTWMEEHLSAYGDRFHGYFSGLSFNQENEKTMSPRMDEIFSRPYYVGFKMHNNHWSIPVNDPRFEPVWKYADKHHLPILLHTWDDKYDAPKMLTDIVARYPNAIFILGHSGNADRMDAEILVRENPNVYMEWCGSFLNPADWRETLDRLGNSRLVYGSDFISWEAQWGHDPAWEMGRLLSLDVPDETLIPILGENMRKILAQRR